MHASAPRTAGPPGPAPLAALRDEIDALDGSLLALIARRLEIAAAVRTAKGDRPLFRPERERQILERVTAGAIPPALARAVWAELIGAMLAAEGLSAVLVTNPALSAPARLRFGRMLPVDINPDALSQAHRRDVIVLAEAGAAPPPGCAVLDHIMDETGRIAGVVIGPLGDEA